jgi:chemotaxis family two-component system response regulator PixG
MLTPSFVKTLEPPIAIHHIVDINEFSIQLQTCNQKKFTGSLDLVVKDLPNTQWSLYFHQGAFIGCYSQLHPHRRWYRQLSIHCPQLIIDAANQGVNQLECSDYHSLEEMVKQGKIEQEQMESVVEGHILEILFDIHQIWEKERYVYGQELQLIYRAIPKNTLDEKLIEIPVESTWRQASKLWEAWQRASLQDCSPNLAPIICKTEELQQQTSPLVYRNLTTLADGTLTFRDLAAKLNRSLLLLTQPIMPFINKGLMGLIEVEDYSDVTQALINSVVGTKAKVGNLAEGKVRSVESVQQSPNFQHPKPHSTPKVPLIVSIDDSRIDSMAMNRIITEAGYRCISIQEPVKALPILLENKPDLIFLDLVMPIANGYEVCGQIRRISIFQDTPIIILTSNDGIVDRVRAKMVGSSGFLSKPIVADKVLSTLQKYIEVKPPNQEYQNMQSVRA